MAARFAVRKIRPRDLDRADFTFISPQTSIVSLIALTNFVPMRGRAGDAKRNYGISVGTSVRQIAFYVHRI